MLRLFKKLGGKQKRASQSDKRRPKCTALVPASLQCQITATDRLGSPLSSVMVEAMYCSTGLVYGVFIRIRSIHYVEVLPFAALAVVGQQDNSTRQKNDFRVLKRTHRNSINVKGAPLVRNYYC